MKTSPLQRLFLQHFQAQETITTKEIFEWYCSAKQDPSSLPYRSSVHYLLINPLLHKGALIKLASGLYQIPEGLEFESSSEPAPRSQVLVSTADLTNEELSDDEAFERYIQQKLGG